LYRPDARRVSARLWFGDLTGSSEEILDCKPWGYSVDDIKLFIAEAAKGGAKVNAHVQTGDGAQRAIDAGLHVISDGQQLTPEQHERRRTL
jgi:imidazolonepropionase-like amidohydrolase